MKTKMILTALLAFLLPALVLAAPQATQKKLPTTAPQAGGNVKASQPVPRTLDKMLQQALRTNPQIIESKGRLQQAMAELNRVKLEVTRSVVHAHFELVKLKQQLALSTENYKTTKAKVDSGVANPSEIRHATLDLVALESALEQLKADIAFLTGAATGAGAETAKNPRGPRSEPPGFEDVRRAIAEQVPPPGARKGGVPPVQGAERQKMRQVLQKHVRLSVSGSGRKLDQILLDLMTQSGAGLKVVYHRELDDANIKGISVQLNLGELTLESALQAIADNYPIAFVFRSYGVLVTTSYNSQFFADALIIR